MPAHGTWQAYASGAVGQLLTQSGLFSHADHGEVFTPPWMVEEMLNLVKDESERIDSRFREHDAD
jgi:hypothetical protein